MLPKTRSIKEAQSKRNPKTQRNASLSFLVIFVFLPDPKKVCVVQLKHRTRVKHVESLTKFTFNTVDYTELFRAMQSMQIHTNAPNFRLVKFRKISQSM